MKLFRISLQTKILGLVLTLVLLIIISLTTIFTVMEKEQIERQKGRLVLELSKTIALMPSIKNAFYTSDPAKIIQPIVEKIRKQVGAEFIVVGNKEGIRYSHPIPDRIGRHMVGGDNYRALVLGESYISRAVGSLGPSLRGKSPILDDNGQIIGIVSVGIMQQDIKQQIFNNAKKVASIALIAFIIAIIGSSLLARNIRKDTMGLEPYQIAALYKEKNAVIESVREGILVIDKNGLITVMNQTARRLLNFHGDFTGLKIEKVIPNTQMYDILRTGKSQHDVELVLPHNTLIVNRKPIIDKGQVVGAVASFRDKTEIEQMLNTLSEVRKYSEDLRAQTHEFTNKLYVLSGLLQIGEYDEAIKMIQQETETYEFQNRILFDQIYDRKVQAILLGKLAMASEKKLEFRIDNNSSLNVLPEQIKISHLITILGNLIDNAFEAVVDSQHPVVTFFATDLGNDIIFEISDNGCGIKEENLPKIFTRGFSTKPKGDQSRGYGLSNVLKSVELLNGTIEVQKNKMGGTVFTVYLPKFTGGESYEAGQGGHC
ncbi:ATP-binding protein [Tuberibacillus calidus]|jgi:CitB family two-component system sensor histidine kinase CitS|uniref:ATP-binding protein n=1 Tax=Tuberibacillus calidus TaxID=340097 RepID=UPI0004201E9B|nr:sensor histidine kinase [Tuberibacillus calidus]